MPREVYPFTVALIMNFDGRESVHTMTGDFYVTPGDEGYAATYLKLLRQTFEKAMNEQSSSVMLAPRRLGFRIATAGDQ